MGILGSLQMLRSGNYLQDDVPVSPGSSRSDYELEVAAVVGRPGSDLGLRGSRPRPLLLMAS